VMEVFRFVDRKRRSLFVKVTRGEALALISSLSEQMLANSPNAGRAEFSTNKGEYFSVAVVPEWADPQQVSPPSSSSSKSSKPP
jgi:hypothetical protein